MAKTQIQTGLALFMGNARHELWGRTEKAPSGKLVLDCYFASYRDNNTGPLATHCTYLVLHVTINDDVVFEQRRNLDNFISDKQPDYLDQQKDFMAIQLMNDCMFLGILEMHRQLLMRLPTLYLRKRTMRPRREEESSYTIEPMV